MQITSCQHNNSNVLFLHFQMVLQTVHDCSNIHFVSTVVHAHTVFILIMQ